MNSEEASKFALSPPSPFSGQIDQISKSKIEIKTNECNIISIDYSKMMKWNEMEWKHWFVSVEIRLWLIEWIQKRLLKSLSD